MLILKECKWWAPLNLVASGHQEKLLSSSFSFLEDSAFEICLFDGERQKWLSLSVEANIVGEIFPGGGKE